MTATSAATVQRGKVTVTDFGLSYDTLEGLVEAVRDASIHVDPGEFVSIIGPSGCGKSTLLNAVAGFLKPTRGEVAVDGDPVARPSADRGMVFQQYSLFPWKTVRENVEFGLKMKGMERSKRETSARTLLGLTGLLAFENQYPDSLSGGMKRASASSARSRPGRRCFCSTSRSAPSTRRPASSCSRSLPTCGSG